MSIYLTNDTELTSIANKIREKSGGINNLTFPSGFINEIGNIVTGGGDVYYVSSTGLLYTPIMTIDLSSGRASGYALGDILGYYGNMPYLEELTLIGVCRQTNGANGQINATEARFGVNKYPLLKKLHIIPSEIRKSDGSVIDTSNTYYNCFAVGHYVFSETNLRELTLGKINGPYWRGSGYFRKKDENGNSNYTVGSTDGLTLKIYVASYLNKGGFAIGSVASNTTIIEYDYLTGEILTP